MVAVELQRRPKVSLIVCLAKCTEESGELDIPIILATVVVIIVVSPCHYGGEEKGDTVFNKTFASSNPNLYSTCSRLRGHSLSPRL